MRNDARDVLKFQRTLFLVLCVLAVPVLRAAQLQVPDTPVARQFSAWLEPFNAADRAGLGKFIEERLASKGNRTVDQELAFRNQTGGFELVKVEESTATRLSGLVKERDSDQFARVTVEVETAEPHRILRFGLQAISRPPEFRLPRMTESELLAALRAELEKRVAADRFAGAVLVARNGKALFSDAYGLADRESKVPNRNNTYVLR